MSNIYRNSDQLIKQKFNNYSEKPDRDIWNNIDKYLSGKRIAKRKFIFKIAATIAIIISVGGGLFITQNNSIKRKIVADNYKIETKANKIVEDNEYIEKNNISDNRLTESISKKKANNINPEKSINTNSTINNNRVEKSNSIVYQEIRKINTIPVKIKKSISQKVNKAFIIENFNKKSDDFHFNLIAEKTIENTKSKNYKISVGGQFSPAYSYRYLGASAKSNDYRDYYNSVENGLLTFSGGFTVQVETNKRLSVQTGIYYASNGQQLSQINTYANIAYDQISVDKRENSFLISNSLGDVQFNSKYVFVDQTNARVDVASSNKLFFDSNNPNFYNIGAKIIQSYNYIEIPLLLRYKLIDKDIDFNILGGLCTNMLVGNNVFLQYDGKKERIGETANLQKINYSSTMGFGIEYSIFNNIRVKLEPTINYYLNSISNNSSIDSHPYSIAVFSGINYTF